MSTGNPINHLGRIAVISLIIFGLVGCSRDSTPASISRIYSQSKHKQQAVGKMRIKKSSVYPTQPVESETQRQNYGIAYHRSYGNIPKGSYRGDTYKVKHGDTLFYIAWITGNDFRDLAQRNNINTPYSLSVGQTLQVGNGFGSSITGENALTISDVAQRKQGAKLAPNKIKTSTVAQQGVITYSGEAGKSSADRMLSTPGTTVATTTAPVTVPTISSTAISSTPVAQWHWPLNGTIIDKFSASEGGNKGIDIAGSRGQPIAATASGRVVYAGNALRGYGNLIIIKHNDDYLSAYAHNDTLLVHDQQVIQAGQKIATMGSTGTSSVRLHFEIRYKGKSVNPLRYLTQR